MARLVGLKPSELENIAHHASGLYRVASRRRKADGTVRETFDAYPDLKRIQRSIKKRILDQVVHPHYLFGGIKRRDAARNAAEHVGSRVKISCDIARFFDSVNEASIYDIWRGFFNFPHEVAEILTKLTTRYGALAQGSITSSGLANLLFFRDEPSLVAHLEGLGIRYSRFVDDIDCSSTRPLRPPERAHIERVIAKMVRKHLLSLKDQKRRLQFSSERLITTGLVVNRRVAVPRSRRCQIRAEVHKLEASLETSGCLGQAGAEIPRLSGLVAYLWRFHPREARLLRGRLDDAVADLASRSDAALPGAICN
ncbi:MAG: reverse transcriptase family protein [Bryobacteraceae bacterium]